MAGGFDLTQTGRTGWQVTFGATGGFDFGALDDVTVNLIPMVDDIIIPSVGKAPLGGRICGLASGSKITIICRQASLELFQKALPWYSSGSIAVTPATVNVDEYTYADLLNLHPIAQGDVTTQDINLLKAVPRFPNPKFNGNADSQVPIDFVFYPDRAQLPTLVYGYIGDPP